jgi:segregation and condensation protein B
MFQKAGEMCLIAQAEPMTEDADASVEEGRLKSILESLLFAAGDPVGVQQLANALDDVPRETIRQALAAMAAAYSANGRGIVLEEVAGGYQLRTPKEHALFVRRLLAAKPPRLSRPLMETLAIIAYRQPITRPEIEQLRGVDSGGVLDTLLERSLVKVAGRKETAGRPMMYATSGEFLELFGLKSLESLPDLEEFRALGDAPGIADEAGAGELKADAEESTPEDPPLAEEQNAVPEDRNAAVEEARATEVADASEGIEAEAPGTNREHEE